MNADQIKAIEPLLDQIAGLADKHLGSAELRRLIGECSNLMGEGLSANINITVDVYDEQRECSLPLLTTGLSAFPGKEPFRTWGDSSLQRYVVSRGIVCLPHDRCPECWHVWDFKLTNGTCSHCGLTMGDQCKLLIDSDECPWCNEGEVTSAEPRCNKCGYELDRNKAVWG